MSATCPGPTRPGRPYVDRPVGDPRAAARAAAEACRRWGFTPPRLLRLAMNGVFATTTHTTDRTTGRDVVIRVGRPSVGGAGALELAEVLERHGLRVPRPVVDDVVEVGPLVVSAWERIVDTGGAVDWRVVGEQVRRLHGLDPTEVPDGHPLPDPTSFPWWDFEAMLAAVSDDLDAGARRGIEAVLARHEGWRALARTAPVVCHGDVHPGNVIAGPHGPVLVDWDLLCRASPWWDHGPLMTWSGVWGGPPGVYEAFAEGYGESGRGVEAAEALAELRLVAATLMRLRAGRDDPVARAEAERRLRTWRGEAGVTWSAQ